jgi:amino acid adenylation domain-containing protein
VNASVYERFEAHARREPAATAAIADGRPVTYGELAALARRIAGALADAGVGPDDIVPIAAPRGLPFLAAMLGVLGAQAAYWPLDIDHPPLRALATIRGMRPRAALVDEDCPPALRDALASEESALVPLRATLRDVRDDSTETFARASGAHAAYMITTSGSSGPPKGAVVERRGMENHLAAKIATLDLGARDVIAQTAPHSFDISVWQMLAPLVVGATTAIVSDEAARDPIRLWEATIEHGVTVLEIVPSMLGALLDALEASRDLARATRLRWLVATGEALPARACARWLRLFPDVPVVNAYGPTECSDDVTHHVVRRALDAAETWTPIGGVLPGVRVHVLDGALAPVKDGELGELFVGGVQVGRGYLADAPRTAASFVPDPFASEPGARLYRTGDRVRAREDGSLEFCGRADDQIKIRGHRIEIFEIESALRSLPGVADAAAAVRNGPAGDPQVVAWIVRSGAASAPIDRAPLRERLPNAACPTVIVEVDALPTTANGKIARDKVPAPSWPGATERANDHAAANDLEATIVAVLTEALRVPSVGLDDNFFDDLGGNSITIFRVCERLRVATGRAVRVSTFFRHPTARTLAAHLRDPNAAPVAAGRGTSSSDERARALAAQRRRRSGGV